MLVTDSFEKNSKNPIPIPIKMGVKNPEINLMLNSNLEY